LIGSAVHRRPWRAHSRATIGVVVAVAALAPAPAGAVIVPKRSIAGIALHMTRSDVRAQLGKPASRFRRPFGASGSSFPAWRYASKRLTIVFVDGDSLFVDTRDATEKTSRGIGPGSTREELINAHPHVHCVSKRFCEIGSATGVAPKPYTGFRLRRGIVQAVELSVAMP